MDANTDTSKNAHVHAHTHDPSEKKKHLNRLSRIIGHLEYIKGMIDRDEDCSDVLMQLASAKSALNGLGKSIINEHLTHCIVHAIEDGAFAEIEGFQKSIQKYI